MSAGSSPRRQLATWNPARSVWETDRSALCGHSELFSETWPSWGMTLGGVSYTLPTPEPPTPGPESSSSPSLLPTPAAGNPNDGEPVESWEARRARERTKGQNGNGMGTPLSIAVRQQVGEPTPLLVTPTAQLAVNGGSQPPEKRRAGGHGQTLADQVEHLLPTPRASEARGPGVHGKGGQDLRTVVAMELLPTPRASDGAKGGPNQRGSSGDLMLPAAVHRIRSGERTAPPSDGGS